MLSLSRSVPFSREGVSLSSAGRGESRSEGEGICGGRERADLRAFVGEREALVLAGVWSGAEEWPNLRWH